LSPAAMTELAAGVMTQVAEENNQLATYVAATVAAQPTRTPLSTFTPLPSATWTLTPLPTETFTSTPPPTATATAKPTATKAPTPKPAAVAPKAAAPASAAAPTSAPAAAAVPIYGYISGPAGYLTFMICTRAGVKCQPVMPPGELDFRMSLTSAADTPWTRFDFYGLSVERDGANMADMYMTAAAGWLRPGATAVLDANRVFSLPGHYTIRSSGCMATAENQPCSWTSLAGDTMSFTIQP
jgi:hypothetical protein